MSAAVVRIAPDDLDQVVDLPAAAAISNLAAVHRLPIEHPVYRTDRHNGHPVLFVTVSAATAEQWRAAFGAPPFTDKPKPFSVQHITERPCWFGVTIRLSYSTAA